MPNWNDPRLPGENEFDHWDILAIALVLVVIVSSIVVCRSLT